METPARVGVVLAGGFATRFAEGEKLLAEVAGEPLLGHAIEGVAPAVDGVVVSCREEQLDAFRPIFDAASVPVAPAPDPEPDQGPTAGLANALEAVSAPWVAVVAGDMPFVDAGFLDELFERVGDSDAAFPEVDGHQQPTHGVSRTDALAAAAEASLADDDGSLRAVLDRLDATVIPEETVRSLTERRTFFDVNTVVDLEGAADLAADRDP